MLKTAIFPGSFDPFTKGHHSLVCKAIPLFDKIIVAVGQNSSKNAVFDLTVRVNALKQLYANQQNVEVLTFTGLTVDLCKQHKANYILRGLRNGIDFEYEKPIAHMNKAMHNQIETVFFLTEPQFESISSTIVREIYKNGGDIKPFLPEGYLV